MIPDITFLSQYQPIISECQYYQTSLDVTHYCLNPVDN